MTIYIQIYSVKYNLFVGWWLVGREPKSKLWLWASFHFTFPSSAVAEEWYLTWGEDCRFRVVKNHQRGWAKSKCAWWMVFEGVDGIWIFLFLKVIYYIIHIFVVITVQYTLFFESWSSVFNGSTKVPKHISLDVSSPGSCHIHLLSLGLVTRYEITYLKFQKCRYIHIYIC